MVSFAYNILSEIMQIRSHLHFLLNLLQTTIKRKGHPYGDCEDPVEYFKNNLVRYTTQVCAFILLKQFCFIWLNLKSYILYSTIITYWQLFSLDFLYFPFSEFPRLWLPYHWLSINIRSIWSNIKINYRYTRIFILYVRRSFRQQKTRQ